MPGDLTTSDLKRLKNVKHDLVVLDVRPPDAYRERHVPGAKSAPFEDVDDFDAVVAREVPDKHAAVVTYGEDRADDRSTKAARRLEDAGFLEVHVLTAGMAAWAELPTHSEGGGAAPATEGTQEWTPGEPPRH